MSTRVKLSDEDVERLREAKVLIENAPASEVIEDALKAIRGVLARIDETENPCNCVDIVNEHLKARNTVLEQAIVFGHGKGDNLMLRTLQVATHELQANGKSKRLPKASAMFASCCPFCGQNYERRAEAV